MSGKHVPAFSSAPPCAAPSANAVGSAAAAALHAPRLALAALGMLALLLGVLVYLNDRPAAHAALIPAAAIVAGAPVFGALGNSLPSFLHPFAFSLLSAAARPADASPAYSACAAWWAVNLGFEFAQMPELSASVARAIEAALGRTWLSRPLTQYVLRGTFDVGDLVAATAGALAAAGVLALLHRREILHARH